MKTFGLAEREIRVIERILQKYPMIKDVRIFGSRSKQTAHAGSDIDLAIMNNGVGFDELLRLRSDFEDSNLPYTVDVVYYPEIKHQELKEHIDRMGAVFYRV